MKDKIYNFILEHSFKIMIAGFAVSAIGIIFYSQVQRKDPQLSTIAFATTAAGIAIYLVGRIALVVQRRKERRERMKAAKTPDGEQEETP
ncbi:MAG: hypothetical protein JW768_09420 [Chitinispirillaceae bacterium]|nr:hypothetical protein [Chitinispirillaceae bacterium]